MLRVTNRTRCRDHTPQEENIPDTHRFDLDLTQKNAWDKSTPPNGGVGFSLLNWAGKEGRNGGRDTEGVISWEPYLIENQRSAQRHLQVQRGWARLAKVRQIHEGVDA